MSLFVIEKERVVKICTEGMQCIKDYRKKTLKEAVNNLLGQRIWFTKIKTEEQAIEYLKQDSQFFSSYYTITTSYWEDLQEFKTLLNACSMTKTKNVALSKTTANFLKRWEASEEKELILR